MKEKIYKNILKETGDWSGVLLVYRFLILGGVKPRFLIEPNVIEFSGKDEEEMLESFERSAGSLEEWKLRDKHYRECDLFPDEVNQKLLEFNLQKYVKKIS